MRNKSGEILDSLIAKEQEKKAKLKEQEKEIKAKLKSCNAAIKKYELMKNSNQYAELSKALYGTGVEMSDILSAIASGDFLGLQEKMEAAAQESNAEN